MSGIGQQIMPICIQLVWLRRISSIVWWRFSCYFRWYRLQ